MTEAEFGAGVYARMVAEGHMGIVRFGSFNTEIEVGQIGFGENSIYPTSFDGPGGSRGVSPAAPVLGSHDRRLRKGDLVFIDNACGIGGYQTDKTMTYLFGGDPPEDAAQTQHRCEEIQETLASLLVPGAIPSEIYAEVTGSLDNTFLQNFMGFGARRVNFLGHGTGLQVNEIPVIAKGFDSPLGEGMAIALEPKKGIAGFGMVGIENTFLVTPGGGESITGTAPGLIRVGK
jgi:Xaa-Pro dipeptidase